MTQGLREHCEGVSGQAWDRDREDFGTKRHSNCVFLKDELKLTIQRQGNRLSRQRGHQKQRHRAVKLF